MSFHPTENLSSRNQTIARIQVSGSLRGVLRSLGHVWAPFDPDVEGSGTRASSG